PTCRGYGTQRWRALAVSWPAQRPSRATLVPYTTLFRSIRIGAIERVHVERLSVCGHIHRQRPGRQRDEVCEQRDLEIAITLLAKDRKSTRLNSSHVKTSYAVFCFQNKTASPAHYPCCQW